MNKVLVKLYVLKIDQEFELFLPPNKTIGDIICMIAKSLNQLTNGIFPLNFQNLIFDMETNIMYAPNLSLKDAQIKNGKKLLFL